MTQVPVRFVTQHEQYAIPTASIMVPTDMRRIGLSEVVNHLRGGERPIPFDFFINGLLLRTSLQDYLSEQGLTTETALELEYVPSLIPPKEQTKFSHHDWISSVDASGSSVVTASYDGLIRVWDRSGSVQKTLDGHAGQSLYCVKKVSTDEDILLAGCQDRTVSVWKNGVKQASLVGHTNVVHAVDATSNGSTACSGSWDGTINLWDLKSACDMSGASSLSSKKRKVDVSDAKPVGQLLGHTGPITQLSFANNDDAVAYSCGWDKTLRFWNVQTLTETGKRTCSNAIQSMSVSKKDGRVATGHPDGSLRIWDPRTFSQRGNAETLAQSHFLVHTNWISGVAWSPRNEHQLVTAGYDGQVRIVDVRGKAALHVIKEAGGKAGGKVLCCDWQGEHVFFGGEDNELHVYGVKNFG